MTDNPTKGRILMAAALITVLPQLVNSGMAIAAEVKKGETPPQPPPPDPNAEAEAARHR